MASGTKNDKGKAVRDLKAATDAVNKKQVPWGTIIGVVAIAALAAVVIGYYIIESEPQRAQEEREQAAASFQPSEDNPDPSKDIEGVVIEDITGRGHVERHERVAYEQSPPIGGAHEGVWAACSGVVYSEPVRSENMVHTLEHGAIWVAYDPDSLSQSDIDLLELRVENKPFISMTPYPDLDKPISLQAWGHQLKLDSAEDERIDQFIVALKRNPTTTPEQNATCEASPGAFDVDNPPPFNAAEPGEGAKPQDYNGNVGMGGAPGAGDGTPAEG